MKWCEIYGIPADFPFNQLTNDAIESYSKAVYRYTYVCIHIYIYIFRHIQNGVSPHFRSLSWLIVSQAIGGKHKVKPLINLQKIGRCSKIRFLVILGWFIPVAVRHCSRSDPENSTSEPATRPSCYKPDPCVRAAQRSRDGWHPKSSMVPMECGNSLLNHGFYSLVIKCIGNPLLSWWVQ